MFAALTQLAGLQKVDLGANQIRGPLGAAPGEGLLNTDINYLDLGGNPLTGTVPVLLGKMTDLLYLNLSYCGLSGSLPDSL